MCAFCADYAARFDPMLGKIDFRANKQNVFFNNGVQFFIMKGQTSFFTVLGKIGCRANQKTTHSKMEGDILIIKGHVIFYTK